MISLEEHSDTKYYCYDQLYYFLFIYYGTISNYVSKKLLKADTEFMIRLSLIFIAV